MQFVGRLVESFTPHGAARNTKALHALELWNCRRRRAPCRWLPVRQR
ncbi:hypothetical protein [Streptomyces sp. NPDC006463]